MSSSDAISDASPARKKPKATQGNCTGAISDAEESSDASSGHCLKDCGRSGCLKLCIKNVNDFIQSEEDVEGDWTNISGFKWRIIAAIDDGFFMVQVECESEVKAKWHCKAKYGVRLETRRPESRYNVQDCDLFDETHGSWGFPLMKTNL
ncbi:hypothetical protein AAVH_14716 [Aphelenchoides avenae]|nr:hypothetical protein AAVH_14716 [Aphelenchus avenae]